MNVVVEQRDGKDSPTTAACDMFVESPPMTAVVVIQQEVAAFESALGDVMQAAGDVGSEARSVSRSLDSVVVSPR